MGAPAKGVVLERADLAAWGQAMRDANRTVAFTNESNMFKTFTQHWEEICDCSCWTKSK